MLIMTIDHKMKDEKLQQDIYREAAKISALSSKKVDKYEFMTGEEILPLYQIRAIEQAKFTLGKVFTKQTKKLKSKEKNKLEL